MGNLLMAVKTIQLGNGVMIKNDRFFRRIQRNVFDVAMCGESTMQLYSEIKHLITADRRYLRASPGMLMGRLNVGSTTFGLLAVNHRMDPNVMKVITLRSSADSMTKYMGVEADSVSMCVMKNKRNLEMISINLSKDKTFLFREGYGEYTSWYMDGQFVTQFWCGSRILKTSG